MTVIRKPRPRDPLQLAKLIGDIAAGQVEPHPATLQAIRHAFENAGVEFIPGGARLREQTAAAQAS